ncbi:beta-1,4-galactosyltransferase 4-like [Haliotis rufescens]|uniref:beta-1,4-galactosyltransferase 4-like n=1 Tax=Haliotis rufescens TaxID=6454 RepID=UPI001EB016BF|nr:beta-1,4-galactosyltransferase 4-like [Haliotis rufescens]
MKIILPCSFTLLTSDTTCLTPTPGYAPAGHYGFLNDKDGQLHLTYTTNVAGTLCTEVASFCTELQYFVLRMCMGMLRGLRRRCPGWLTLLVLVMLLWWFCERGDYAQLPPITVSPYIDAKLLNPMGLSKCLTSSGQGRLRVNKQNVSYEEVQNAFAPLGTGAGHFRPPQCAAEQKSAIIIPFRNRHHHLPILLNNLVPYLLRQRRDFTFYVVEQGSAGVFNKALMMNAGFMEAMRRGNYDCYIFHDVDLIPEDDRIPYTCRPGQVAHLVAAVRKYYYHAMRRYIGGVLAFTEQQFRGVNGFSNLYMGWGGEDDDMRFRLDLLSNPVYEVSIQIGRYYSFNHSTDEGNPVNHHRKELLWEAGKRAAIDGITSLKYTVDSVEESTLFTWVKVRFDPQHYSPLFNAVVDGSLEMP